VIILVLVWRKSIHIWRRCEQKTIFLRFRSQWPWPLTFRPQLYSTKMEVSKAFRFRKIGGATPTRWTRSTHRTATCDVQEYRIFSELFARDFVLTTSKFVPFVQRVSKTGGVASTTIIGKMSIIIIKFVSTTVCISTDSECNHRDTTVQDNSGRIRCDVLILRWKWCRYPCNTNKFTKKNNPFTPTVAIWVLL